MSALVGNAIATSEFYSRDGYQIKFDAARWRLSKDIDIPVDDVSGYMQKDCRDAFRSVLAFYAVTSSPSHTRNLFERFKHYLDASSSLSFLSVESFVNYRAALDTRTAWYLGALRGFVRRWDELGYFGVPAETLALLDKWVIKGNEKGFAVQSMCPDSGPLTDIEMEAVTAAVAVAFGDHRLSLLDTCLATILSMTGRRPSQIAALKVKDLICVGDKYFINFPRAKQRNQGWRAEFNKFPIVKDLWSLLELQQSWVKSEFEKVLGYPVPVKCVSELPLFPAKEILFSDICELESGLDGDYLHAESISVKEAMSRVAKVISVISERTGFPVHLNPTRFRYTLGTNLAREGKGEYVIAEALDHSDTQNAGVYVRNIPEIVERIDKAVALQLAPIAQAFQGRLVALESDARRGNDRTSRISDGASNVGSCGSYGFCSALAPVACYTCLHFQPWLDGPHESVLDGLIKERDSVLESTGDLKIASVNDRLILAVSDVVNRCTAMKGEVYNG